MIFVKDFPMHGYYFCDADEKLTQTELTERPLTDNLKIHFLLTGGMQS